MGKVSKTCCINKCENKSGKDGDKHSFHIFPSEGAENYQAWMAAVTPHQKKPKPSQKHFYVCDEHFEQGCFLKEDCTILVNGVEKKIPRKIKRLKPNSIPSLFHGSIVNDTDCRIPLKPINHNHSDHQYTSTEREICATVLSSSEGDSAVDIPVEIVRQNVDHQCRSLSREVVPAENIEESVVDSVDDQCTIIEHDKYMSPLLTKSEVALPDNGVSADHEYTVAKQELPSLATPPYSTVDMPADNIMIEQKITKSPLTITSMKNVAHLYISVIKSNSIVEKSVQHYSREELTKDLKDNSFSTMFKNWGVTETPENVFFIYHGVNMCGNLLTRVLTVRKDMSTELQFCGRTSSYPIIKRIKCFDDFCTTLMTIASLQICAGVNCKDGLFQPKARSNSVRCSSCQKADRLEKDKERKRTKRAEQKKNKRAKNNKNLKQKYRRSLKKIASLEENLDDLMVQCLFNAH